MAASQGLRYGSRRPHRSCADVLKWQCVYFAEDRGGVEVGKPKGRVRLSLEVGPELHRRVKIAAASRDMTVKDFVSGILSQAVENEGLVLAPTGVKPAGGEDPPRPRGGGDPVSGAVIEDRR